MLHPGKAGLKVLGDRRGEKNYIDLPKLYTFPSREAKEHILYEHAIKIRECAFKIRGLAITIHGHAFRIWEIAVSFLLRAIILSGFR